MIARITWFVKEHQLTILLGITAILLALLSFGIGYLAARERLREPIRSESIEKNGI